MIFVDLNNEIAKKAINGDHEAQEYLLKRYDKYINKVSTVTTFNKYYTGQISSIQTFHRYHMRRLTHLSLPPYEILKNVPARLF